MSTPLDSLFAYSEGHTESLMDSFVYWLGMAEEGPAVATEMLQSATGPEFDRIIETLAAEGSVHRVGVALRADR